MFDRSKERVLTGTIREFQWTNPHLWIQVSVRAPGGAAEEWSIEGQSPNTLSRKGWKRTSFKPGDKVSIRVYPMRDGSKAGLFVGAILADGHVLGSMEASDQR
jgi:hypothetical protein